MEFKELLSYAREYKAEMKNDKYYDLRDFLELIQNFDIDEIYSQCGIMNITKGGTVV